MQYVRVIACLLPLLVVGCGGVPQEKLTQAQEAVVTALEAWKKGGKPPEGFTEPALAAGQKLVSYEVLRTEADREGVIRTFVKLSLRDRRGKEAERQVAYMVTLASPPVVSNDPMF